MTLQKYGFTSHLSHCLMFNKLFGKSCLQALPNTPFSSKSQFFPLLLRAGRTSPAWNLLQSLDITHKLCVNVTCIIHNNICFNNKCRSLPYTFDTNGMMIPINRSSYQRSKSKIIIVIIINNNLCFEPL